MPLCAAPAARFADGRTRGGLPEGHVSIGQEPPGSATYRFALILVHLSLACQVTFLLKIVTRVFWLLSHVALQSAHTCHRLVVTRGIGPLVHTALLSSATCRH